MTDNAIGDAGAAQLTECLLVNTTLRSVILNMNFSNISGKCCDALEEAALPRCMLRD